MSRAAISEKTLSRRGDSKISHRGNETVSQSLLVRGSLWIEGATMC